MRGVEQVPWIYDSGMWILERLGLASWRRWLVRRALGWTLEVGSGTGRNLPLYPAAVRLVALEPDPVVIRTARRRRSAALFVRGSAEALPFREGAFDTVVSSLAFCSVPDPLLGLEEVRRVLKPDGSLRMIEHVRHPTRVFARIQDMVQPAWTELAGGCHPNRDIEDLVERAGFTIEREEGDRLGAHGAKGVLRRFRARPS